MDNQVTQLIEKDQFVAWQPILSYLTIRPNKALLFNGGIVRGGILVLEE